MCQPCAPPLSTAVQVALHHALVAQRPQLPQLALPHAAAGGGELAEDGLGGEALIQRDQFAHFVARRVAVGALDSRQFEREGEFGIGSSAGKGGARQVMHRHQAQRGGNRAERDEAVRRAELLGQGMPIAQPLGRVAQRQLCLIDHVFGRQVRSTGSCCSPYQFHRALAA